MTDQQLLGVDFQLVLSHDTARAAVVGDVVRAVVQPRVPAALAPQDANCFSNLIASIKFEELRQRLLQNKERARRELEAKDRREEEMPLEAEEVEGVVLGRKRSRMEEAVNLVAEQQ